MLAKQTNTQHAILVFSIIIVYQYNHHHNLYHDFVIILLSTKV